MVGEGGKSKRDIYTFSRFHLEKSILTTHSKRGSMGQVIFNLFSSFKS